MKTSLPLSSFRALSAPRIASRLSAAFTLVEMLAVMGVIALIIGIAAPAVTSLSGNGEVSKAVYDIAGILEQSRAYAMSNNTYVYVGFFEADASSSESIKQVDVIPSSSGGSSGSAPKPGGRVSVAVIATKDGTRGGYTVNNSEWAGNYGRGNAFLTVGKLQRFNNLHIVYLDSPPTPDTQSGMVRPPYTTAVPTAYNLGNSECNPVTSFEYPLGYAPNTGTYTFKKVIQYDPQGVARLQEPLNTDVIVKVIEIGLQQTHGNVAPTLSVPAKTGNIAALQIECMTGSTHIYRP